MEQFLKLCFAREVFRASKRRKSGTVNRSLLAAPWAQDCRTGLRRQPPAVLQRRAGRPAEDLSGGWRRRPGPRLLESEVPPQASRERCAFWNPALLSVAKKQAADRGPPSGWRRRGRRTRTWEPRGPDVPGSGRRCPSPPGAVCRAQQPEAAPARPLASASALTVLRYEEKPPQ